MEVTLAKIECSNIKDWDSFHDEFNRVFGFPDFYGRNMDAWIDCMTSIDSPQDGMTNIHAKPGPVVTIELTDAADFKKRCPEQWESLNECTAFVNWRRIERQQQSVLALSYDL